MNSEKNWAIAVRRGSYKSLFLLNLAHFSLEKKGDSVLNFGSLKTLLIAVAQVLSPLINSEKKSVGNHLYGAEFCTPPPPHPYKYPSRGVGSIKGGEYNIPAAWGLKIYTPPLPEKCILARNGGRGWGGGVF